MISRFHAASEKQINKVGWVHIFNKYDTDGSGGLDHFEFIECVRSECALPFGTITDDELEELFGVIDADASAVISADEFFEALTANDADNEPEMTYFCLKRPLFELANCWSQEPTESAYLAFLHTIFDRIVELSRSGRGAPDSLPAKHLFAALHGTAGQHCQ